MAINNDERREIAARLRDVANTRCTYDRAFFFASMIRALLMERGASVDEIINRLADLIEPEPERTCRVERTEIDEFGRYFYLSCGHMQMTHNTSALPFCPDCGARVIGG